MLSSLEIEKIESVFRQNQYNGNLQSPAPFQMKQGKTPILLVSPYATNYLKHQSMQSAHRYTGSFVHTLQKVTNCYAATRTRYVENEENIFVFLKENGFLTPSSFSMIFEVQRNLFPAHDDIVIGYNKEVISSAIIEDISQTFHTYGIFHIREKEVSTSYPILQLYIHPKWIQPNESLISHQLLYNAFSEIILHHGKK